MGAKDPDKIYTTEWRAHFETAAQMRREGRSVGSALDVRRRDRKGQRLAGEYGQ